MGKSWKHKDRSMILKQMLTVFNLIITPKVPQQDSERFKENHTSAEVKDSSETKIQL